MKAGTTPADLYRIADFVRPAACDHPVRNMMFLVAYDVCSPARLRQVAKVCEDYGVRVEKSVFECDLSPEDFDFFWLQLEECIDRDDDSIAAYRVCAACAGQIRSLGAFVRPQKRLVYVL